MFKWFLIPLMLLVPTLARAECVPRDEMMSQVQGKAEVLGAVLVDLTPLQSQAFLAKLNAMGEPTNFAATAVFIVVNQGEAWVFLDTNGCVDTRQVHITETAFKKLMAAIAEPNL